MTATDGIMARHNSTLDYARAYCAAGINLLAIKTDGSKSPAPECLVDRSWKYLQERAITEEEVARFFGRGNGLAAIGGAISGNLEAIDFDDLDTYQEWRKLAKECLTEDFLESLLIVQTPRPGVHVITRCLSGVGPSQKLAQCKIPNPKYDPAHKGSPQQIFKTLIETKGEGGYFLLPGCPSACHLAGRLYKILQGTFESVPVIAAVERETMLLCARSLDRIAREELLPQPSSPTRMNGLLPGDDFNARGPSWAVLLARYGFKFHSQRGETSYWTRPGKDRGISASTNHGGHDCFYPFSTSLPFDVERGYQRFAVYTILEHGGDYARAARALASEGYGRAPHAFPPQAGSGDEEREAIQAEASAAERESRIAEYSPVTPPGSFITQYVIYASQRTDAPPEAHELLSVGLLSALAGPNPRLPIATHLEGWSLAIWVLYCVDSTTGRKTTCINSALDIAEEVLGRDAILFWEGSPQGIIQQLQARDGLSSIFARDEYSGLLSQMNRAGGHMAGLAQMFIRAYDGGQLENIRTKKKNKATGEREDDTDRVVRPYLIKLCASTWESFVTRASIDNVLDGFLARFAVFSGSSKPQELKKTSPELQALRHSLISHARDFHEKARLIGSLDIQDSVLKQAWELERDWTKLAADSSSPDAAGPALKRLSETVFKVAGLLAIDGAPRGEVPILLPEHFDAARQLGSKWLGSTLRLIDALGRTGFQQKCEAVLATIRARSQGAKVRDVYRKHRKLTPREFNDVLTALQTQDEIIIAEGESASGPAFRFVQATRRAD